MIITICASVRLHKEIDKWCNGIYERGHTCFKPEFYSTLNKINLLPQQLSDLSKVHNTKIEMSHLVLILEDEKGLGESVTKERDFCFLINKPFIVLDIKDRKFFFQNLNPIIGWKTGIFPYIRED